MSREDYGWLLDRVRELVLQIEALAQERRPVGITSNRLAAFPLVVYNDGTVVRQQSGGQWEEINPLPGTRRDRELESPTPADYFPALDATEALAEVVEDAQRLVDAGIGAKALMSADWWEAYESLIESLDALKRQQGEAQGHQRLRFWPQEDAPGKAGDCTECGGPVYHRPGKPGEFDHECEVAEERRREETWVPLEERHPEEGQRVEFKGPAHRDTITADWYRGDDPERWGWTHWRPAEGGDGA